MNCEHGTTSGVLGDGRHALSKAMPTGYKRIEVVTKVRIRKMKTRWGTCNREARRVWLNLELAKKPASCLEYILVHEMVHLIERSHNDRFRRLMDSLMPGWRLRRDELNQAPLAHEDWRY